MDALAQNLWTLRFPLRIFGLAEIGRRVSIIRLADGRLLIHSTAPFSPEQIQEITALGQPAFLVEATLMHDTFADAGRAAFPEAAYHTPDPRRKWAAGSLPIRRLADQIGDEVVFRKIPGLCGLQEYAFLHRPSGTLILCDLIFNIGPPADFATRFMLRWVSGVYGKPAVSRLYRMMIRKRAAFAGGLKEILKEWDFDRIIVGHGEVITTDGKAILTGALEKAGLL